MKVRRFDLTVVAAGLVLFAVSFGVLFRAAGEDRVMLPKAREPSECSAWTTCPGMWPGIDWSESLRWVAILGLVVAVAWPLLRRAAPVGLVVGWGFAAVALALLGLTAWQQSNGPYGYDEANLQFTAPPTVWFAVMVVAVIAIPVAATMARRR